MIVKRSIFSLFLLLGILPVAAHVECNVIPDSAALGGEMLTKADLHVAAYQRRVERYERFWKGLIPDFSRVQYAGSIGLVSAGLGWEYGDRQQWETDVMFGFIPKYDSEHAELTFTLRQTCLPWTCRLSSDGEFSVQPFACGLFLNAVLDGNYWGRTPSRYPTANYYWFSSKIRIHLFVGQRYTWHIPLKRRIFSHSISLMWELSTCDLYFVSKAVNKSLPWHEILSLSLGAKWHF